MLLFTSLMVASALAVGDIAPRFESKTQEGKSFKLEDRKSKGWTVLYFYPKADTPGCTTQACAFRDSIKVIRAEGAEVYGISKNSVTEQKSFHKKHNLNFDLLADADGKVIEQYGSKIPVLGISKRWTFLIDPELKIRWVEKDVDPAVDAKRVADELKKLKAQK